MNPQDMKPERDPWYRSKTFKRFRRNPLAIVGSLLLLIFVLVALFAPALTANQLASIRSARPCLRDLGVKRTEVISKLRNPLDPVFWKATFAPPKSCYNIPRDGFSPLPKPPTLKQPLRLQWKLVFQTKIHVPLGSYSFDIPIKFWVPKFSWIAENWPPSAGKHPMGVSGDSYDIMYGLVWGARTAFYVGFLVVGISLAIGIVIGGLSGFIGGMVDNLIMRVTDVMLSFPGLVFVMIIVVIFGNGLAQVMLALAFIRWAGYARFFRGDILRTKSLDFVDAARALGGSPLRIFAKHVFPNAIGTLLIIASMDVGAIVLTAAGLSFLGLGAPVGYADWGQMISFARGYILGTAQGTPLDFWYVWIYPTIMLVLFGLAWNLLGDAVRDALDPKS